MLLGPFPGILCCSNHCRLLVCACIDLGRAGLPPAKQATRATRAPLSHNPAPHPRPHPRRPAGVDAATRVGWRPRSTARPAGARGHAAGTAAAAGQHRVRGGGGVAACSVRSPCWMWRRRRTCVAGDGAGRAAPAPRRRCPARRCVPPAALPQVKGGLPAEWSQGLRRLRSLAVATPPPGFIPPQVGGLLRSDNSSRVGTLATALEARRAAGLSTRRPPPPGAPPGLPDVWAQGGGPSPACSCWRSQTWRWAARCRGPGSGAAYQN